MYVVKCIKSSNTGNQDCSRVHNYLLPICDELKSRVSSSVFDSYVVIVFYRMPISHYLLSLSFETNHSANYTVYRGIFVSAI